MVLQEKINENIQHKSFLSLEKKHKWYITTQKYINNFWWVHFLSSESKMMLFCYLCRQDGILLCRTQGSYGKAIPYDMYGIQITFLWFVHVHIFQHDLYMHCVFLTLMWAGAMQCTKYILYTLQKFQGHRVPWLQVYQVLQGPLYFSYVQGANVQEINAQEVY